MYCLTVSGLGGSWDVAIMNSAEEVLLAGEFAKNITDSCSNRIGGSTTIDQSRRISFAEYIPNSNTGM